MPDDDPASGTSPPAEGPLTGLIDRLETAIVGQRPLLERLVVALLAGGHVLIEGVPGLAKTRAVRALADALDLPFRRIQFTPDLLPADLTGTQVFRPATGTFDVRPGPIVTSVLLADEINRAPAKVQSALLEAMEEGQVTVGDETVRLPPTFWVLATQNPIEHEGTYPLPEAQLDRFLLKLTVDYPDRASELAMLDLPDVAGGVVDRRADPRCSARTTSWPFVPSVARPRRAGGQGVRGRPRPRDPRPAAVRAGPRADARTRRQPPRHDRPDQSVARHAFLRGRDYVTPHDVKSLARDVLRHRILLSYEADAEGLERRRHPRPAARQHPGAVTG